MTITQTVLTGLAGVLFSTSFAAVAGRVALLLVLGIIGFAAAGCVFSAALLRARGRDALLATLLYPIIVPIVIAGARGTTQLIDPVAPDFDGARFWTQFLVAVDILFITAGVWAFEPIAASDSDRARASWIVFMLPVAACSFAFVQPAHATPTSAAWPAALRARRCPWWMRS